ncbi:hypothetical protein GGU11DRAFT_750251 [Lentinula aff. detonsa]|nr:hypothetical protein GGU11DRAFT_750251 [Lentinula aff. detonsa]
MPATSSTYQTVKWLTHYMRLAFRLPKLVTEFETSVRESFEVKVPKLLQAFRAVGVVPFWEEECPAEYEEQWGERWEHIHEMLEQMSNIARKTEVDKFHWTKSDLQDVAKAAKEGGWEACMDSEIESYLKSQEWDIQTQYMSAIQADPKADFVLMGAWDSEMIQIVTHLLGDGALDEKSMVYSVVKDWWHSMILPLLDMSRKYKIWALHQLLSAEKRVKELLGEDFLQSNMRTDFTAKDVWVVITAVMIMHGS